MNHILYFKSLKELCTITIFLEYLVPLSNNKLYAIYLHYYTALKIILCVFLTKDSIAATLRASIQLNT